MLDSTQIETFRDQGFLVVPSVLSDEDLDPVRREYEDILDVRSKRAPCPG